MTAPTSPLLVTLTAAGLLDELRELMATPRPLTSEEAAEFLSVSTSTVRRWAASGVIPGIRYESEWRFVASELLAAGKRTTTPIGNTPGKTA